jgi:8-oxo-dGTP pyrophosphatase MutT (NUDIX family)
VLLIKSAYGSFGWELPGGALEPGETARECVERECGEELGRHISVGPLTGIQTLTATTVGTKTMNLFQL